MSGEHARQRMEAVLAEADVDAVIAISPENVFYLSRALILTQRYIPDRLAIVVWPRGGEPSRAANIHVPCRRSAAFLDVSGSDRFVSTGVPL